MWLHTFDRVIEGEMGLPSPCAQLHQRAIADDRGQPGRHLRLPPELANMPVCGQ
jgi:hypothetical protein